MNAPEPFPPELLDHTIAEHNRMALMYSALALAGALVLWPLLYFLSAWLWLLATTVVGNFEMTLPAGFRAGFLMAALGMIVARFLLAPLLDAHSYDRKILGPHVWGQLFFLPATITREIWVNYRARIRLSPWQRQAALTLLGMVWEKREMLVSQAAALGTRRHRMETVGDQLLTVGLLEFTRTPEGLAYRQPAKYRRSTRTRLQSPPRYKQAREAPGTYLK